MNVENTVGNYSFFRRIHDASGKKHWKTDDVNYIRDVFLMPCIMHLGQCWNYILSQRVVYASGKNRWKLGHINYSRHVFLTPCIMRRGHIGNKEQSRGYCCALETTLGIKSISDTVSGISRRFWVASGDPL